GFSAALLKVPLQHVVRVGSYSILTTIAIEANDRKPLSPLQNTKYMTTAGIMAWACSMPIGLAQIRMQADATFPAAHRRNYTNVFNALDRVIADEGVLALWRGASAISTFSGCALSLPFDYVKTQIQTMQPDAYGKYPYTGFFDCARETFKTGGLAKFYSGFYFYYFRFASSMMISLLVVKLLGRLDASSNGIKKITVNVRRSDV
ncbi:hypothetical protein PIB30_058766, partial [Stylosanthes scabra]|nr:hypothetical protein [Stylosanthes scabra]